jgi:hypothetical protein
MARCQKDVTTMLQNLFSVGSELTQPLQYRTV